MAVSDQKRIVLVDVDGVLSNFELHFYNKFIQEYPDLEPIPLYDRTVHMVVHQYLDRYPQLKVRENDLYGIYFNEGFFKDMPLIPGSKKAMNFLSKHYSVRFCASFPEDLGHCVSEKLEWVKANFGPEFTKKTIVSKDKTMVRGTVLIDDRNKGSGQLEPGWKLVLYDQPYNREDKCDFRVYGWNSDQIEKLMKFVDSLGSNP